MRAISTTIPTQSKEKKAKVAAEDIHPSYESSGKTLSGTSNVASVLTSLPHRRLPVVEPGA
jgi:hypothetical protein